MKFDIQIFFCFVLCNVKYVLYDIKQEKKVGCNKPGVPAGTEEET